MRFQRWAVALILSAAVSSGRIQQIDITGLVGEVVRLPCEIDETNCGKVHNIQWYRGDGDTRVFIYSELADVDTSENMLQGRGYFHYRKGSSLTELEIRALRADDESLYKCELTYLEVRDDCAVIQFVNLTTLARPLTITVLLPDGGEVDDGDVIGPYEEDSELLLRCEAAGGKPAAQVTWWSGTTDIGGDAWTAVSEDGTGLGVNDIRVQLTRSDLGSALECRASNVAVDHPLRSKAYLDLNVKPVSVGFSSLSATALKGFNSLNTAALEGYSGLNTTALEGETVSFTCVALDAKPPANITWKIGAEDVTERSNSTTLLHPNGTFSTVSFLSFTADRTLHGSNVTCMAFNMVTRKRKETSLQAALTIHVQYAPLVSISPLNIVANESQRVHIGCFYDANPANLSSVTWYKNGHKLNVNMSKYKGGDPQNPSLFINNVSRQDAGEYFCEVTNVLGSGKASPAGELTVQYRAVVRVKVSPAVVMETAAENVRLRCDSSEDGPGHLQRVRWHRDGVPMPSLSDCPEGVGSSSTSEKLAPCRSSPQEMRLFRVNRTSMANFTCSGLNGAGWSEPSPPAPLIVQYPPQHSRLTQEPALVQKDSSAVLTCEVSDPGFPPARKYLWMRGRHVVTDISGPRWRILAASKEDDQRFSCVAINIAGSSAEASARLHVHAKPRLIENPPDSLGVLLNSSNISVSCRVECSPLCHVQWLRNAEVLKNSARYRISSTTVPANPDANEFESVVSTLSWNMSAWPDGVLHRFHDNANFTCRSTSNLVGPGVSSSTRFSVQYPPGNVSVSPARVNIAEGAREVQVHCTAQAVPDAAYAWFKGDALVGSGNILTLRGSAGDGVNRTQSGWYLCRATNRHGSSSAAARLTVLYAPDCRIRQTHVAGEYRLVCEADAAPPAVTFAWTFGNYTLSQRIRTEGTISTLTVVPGSRDFGTYTCLVNNSVGAAAPCRIDVAGVSGWQMSARQAGLVITVIAVAVGSVLALLVTAVTYIIYYRRRCKPPAAGFPDQLREGDSFFQGEDRVLIRPSLLPAPPSNPDIVKLSVNVPCTMSSPSGSNASSCDSRPIYETLCLHQTPSKGSSGWDQTCANEPGLGCSPPPPPPPPPPRLHVVDLVPTSEQHTLHCRLPRSHTGHRQRTQHQSAPSSNQRKAGPGSRSHLHGTALTAISNSSASQSGSQSEYQTSSNSPHSSRSGHSERRQCGGDHAAGCGYGDLALRPWAGSAGEPCRAPSKVQKEYVPNQYSVMQFSGVSHEIDV